MSTIQEETYRQESMKGIMLALIFGLLAFAIQLKVAYDWGLFGGAPLSAGITTTLSASLASAGADSLLMGIVSALYEKKIFDSTLWGVSIALIFYLNAALAFLVARKMRRAAVSVSIAVAALTLMNPLGVEAFASRCCMHELLYLTLLFCALLTYRYRSHDDSPWQGGGRSALMVLLQIAAAFVWDFGLLLFPQVALITLFARYEGSRRERKRLAISLLLPMAVCWIVVSSLLIAFREPSPHPFLPVHTVLKQFFLAPVEGLFPLLNFDSAGQETITALALATYLVLLSMAFHGKATLGLILAFFLGLVPWVFFREPTGSDFYISMPLLYLAMTTFKDLKGFGNFALSVYLVFAFVWMFQRLDDVQGQVRAPREESVLLEKSYFVPFRQLR
ncbi:MAG: hypothetical protein KDK48_03670 [Chlamydiia bacterium]|nr:hypothetical protein [Chlamydiia bacterium]